MNTEDRIEAALWLRPADERAYMEPLAPLVAGEGIQRLRPATRPRARTGLMPLVATLAVALCLGAGALVASLAGGGPAPTGNAPTYELTGRVGCFGQGPGFTPTSSWVDLHSCTYLAVPPQGYGAATWGLDPAYSYSGTDTDIHILVTEWACHGDTPATGRVAQNVQYDSGRVIVTLALRPLTGAQTCLGSPGTPYVLHLDQAVGNRGLFDGGTWPVALMATAGESYQTPLITPTPQPSNWHQPMDCSPDVDTAGFFKGASMTATFDVYCAVLPKGWSVRSTGDPSLPAQVNITYAGPSGATLSLAEGAYCEAVPGTTCERLGTIIGPAMFGDLKGTLASAGGGYWLIVSPKNGAMWTASGTGLSLDEFKALCAALIAVAK